MCANGLWRDRFTTKTDISTATQIISIPSSHAAPCVKSRLRDSSSWHWSRNSTRTASFVRIARSPWRSLWKWTDMHSVSCAIPIPRTLCVPSAICLSQVRPMRRICGGRPIASSTTACFPSASPVEPCPAKSRIQERRSCASIAEKTQKSTRKRPRRFASVWLQIWPKWDWKSRILPPCDWPPKLKSTSFVSRLTRDTQAAPSSAASDRSRFWCDAVWCSRKSSLPLLTSSDISICT
mmetsp:Transcript_3926/g.7140  ORF Transcript_3926/g.7140 Transcript_3926/m.7140 type:complete len:237 (+) Transcript_3926:599-1309(+)